MADKTQGPLLISGNCTLVMDGPTLVVRIPTDKTFKAASTGKNVLIGSVGKSQIVIDGVPHDFNINLYRAPMSDKEQEMCGIARSLAKAKADAEAAKA